MPSQSPGEAFENRKTVPAKRGMQPGHLQDAADTGYRLKENAIRRESNENFYG
jgi:hypothetical protein